MRYIATWSGGKDSTASIILAHENKEPLDEIVFCEVMYDKQHNISGMNPIHMIFVKEIAKPVFESWGYKVTMLRSNKDYMDLFWHVIDKPTVHENHKGRKYGFPAAGMCTIQRDLKIKTLDNYLKSQTENVTRYLGICFDEPKRLKRLRKNQVSLLEKYGYTAAMAREKCREYGLLSPHYKLSKRDGCWFCPHVQLEELRVIKETYPEVWNDFVRLEDADVIYNRYNPRRLPLSKIDQILKEKYEQMTLFDYIS